MDDLTPDLVSTLSGETEVWSDKLIMGKKRCGIEFSRSKGVPTQVKFVELLAKYSVGIELACIP